MHSEETCFPRRSSLFFTLLHWKKQRLYIIKRKWEYEIILSKAQDSLANDGPLFCFSILSTTPPHPFICAFNSVFSLLLQCGEQEGSQRELEVGLIDKAECMEKSSHLFSSDQRKMHKRELPEVFWGNISPKYFYLFIYMFLFPC